VTEVRIAIATAPQGLSLDQEIRLLKPALLYADHVTLYSPAAALLGSARAAGEMGAEAMIPLLRAVPPAGGARPLRGVAAQAPPHPRGDPGHVAASPDAG